MKSQRECFLENLGLWEGSFTNFSIAGEQIGDVKSLLRLESIDNSEKVRLTLQRFYPEGKDEKVIEYDPSSLYNILFFENGAFSQGALQRAPFSQFGAELGLIHGDRRLRILQIFDPTTSQIDKITVIRERRSSQAPPERPRLKVEELLGKWEGEVLILSNGNPHPIQSRSTLTVRLESPAELVQEMSYGGSGSESHLSSQGKIIGNTIEFSQMDLEVQLTLLPDGSSALFPLKIESGKSFFLESGWLVEPNLRYRMIRRYDDKGGWQNTVLVKERKVSQ